MKTTRINDRTSAVDLQTSETWTGCESAIKAFELAWRRGESPSIDNFLLVEGPERPTLLAELVHADLEFRLKGGESVRIESYLERYPELAHDREQLRQLVAAEYEFRLRHQTVQPDEYGLRFPELRAELPAIFAPITGAAPGTPARPAASPPTVPGYEIVAEIGRGGMGVVYQARETQLGRQVALKFLPAEVAHDAVLLDRFRREAQTASSLNHPHICTVHALGEHADRPFIVLEFIEGQTLKSLASRRWDPHELARVLRQVAGALGAAHAAGVIHRDIKPENIMLRRDGYVKVLDFGLARRLPTLAPSGGEAAHDTWPGAILGTVAYMSPEQARGESLAAASDIFSLGIVLYQLLTGVHPFDRGTPLATLQAIANSEPLPPSRLSPAAPPALDGLVAAMLHKDARLRPSADDVGTALSPVVFGQRTARQRKPHQVVRRETELAALHRTFAAVQTGRGHLVCVAGEPGIGKTTLVEEFLAELDDRGQCLVARGRCSERQAQAAAYLPVIDALADLLRGESRESTSRMAQLLAPTWHAQLVSPSEIRPGEGRFGAPEPAASPGSDAFPTRAFSQQAMLREFANLLTEVSRLRPVVLFFDDVHWADHSTVDLLAYFGRHCQQLPVLVVVTYRPTEVLLGPHPFHHVKLELLGHGACTDLALTFLAREQIRHYLDLAYAGHDFPADFADLVHARTEGSPLFMVDLLRYLGERGVIAQTSGQWNLARDWPDLGHEMPSTVRSMIQRKFERLDDGDRRLLAAAASQGQEFDSAAIAAALGDDAADVEERLQRLERVHGLVRLIWEDEFPDRTLSQRYAFVHALYQQALFTELSPTRRATLSKALAQALERFYAPDSSPAAAELADLYETGRDLAQAARHFHVAAQNAAWVFAHRDAVALARHGLALLQSLPHSADRERLELPLQTTLGLQLQVTEGYAADSARAAYERARALCPASNAAALFPVLWGLWLVHKVRSELPFAEQLAGELLALARHLHDPSLALQAHQALGLTALCRGQPAAALRHVEQVATLYHPQRHRAHSFLFGQDPGVICKAYGAVALWLLGFPDAAQRESETAIAMSRELSPTSQVVAYHFAAMVYQMCRMPGQAARCAQASAELSAEHGFPFWLAGAVVIGGWAAVVQPAADSAERIEGLNRLRQGLTDWQATGSVTYRTYYDALLADALVKVNDLSEARQVLDESLVLVGRTDEQMVAAELYRLRGELALRERARGAATDGEWTAAARDLETALSIAHQQEARSLELRAAITLVRLLQARDLPTTDAKRVLAEVLRAINEEHHSTDQSEARDLLASLA